METSKRICYWLWVSLSIFLICFLTLSPSSAQAQTTQKVGTVTVLEGRATITHKGEPTAETIQVGTAVYQDDTIRTQPGAKLRVVFIDRSIISVGSNSSVTISEYVFNPKEQVRTGGLNLLWGKVKCFVNDFMGYKNRKFTVTTNTAVIGVRGTVFLVWIVDNQITRVAAFQNEVEVRNRFKPEEFVVLTPNTLTQIQQGQAPDQPILVTEEMLSQLHEGLFSDDLNLLPPGPPETTDTTAAPGEVTTTTLFLTTTTTTSTTTTTTTTTTSTTTTHRTLPGFPGPPSS